MNFQFSIFNFQKQRGFTLVEMMVAVALFAVVMTVSIGALLSLVDANRKAQAVQSVMNNLNIALDGMVRSIRMGTNYHCGNSGQKYQSKDCSNPDNFIAFEPFGSDSGNINDYWAYYLVNVDGIGRIYKRTDTSNQPITAREINISEFKIWVRGAEGTLYNDNDQNQPFVTLVIKGAAASDVTDAVSVLGSKNKIETKFHIQAAASQRILDL